MTYLSYLSFSFVFTKKCFKICLKRRKDTSIDTLAKIINIP